MRFAPLIVIFFLILPGRGSTQDAQGGSFFLQEIPREGLVLDKGWHFKDTGWQSTDPTDEIHHLPLIWEAPIGWFRLDMSIDPALRGQNHAMLVSGFGAMEIFLNGKRIFEFGQPHRDYEREVTRFFTNNLLSLTFDSSARQVIAVRYSFHKKNLYVKFANKRPILKIEFKEINQGIMENIRENNFESTLRTIQVSFYLPLGFLLLFLYMSFRRQKEYVFAGIFCLSLFGAILFHILALSEPVTVNRSNSFLLATQVLYITGAISFIHSMNLLYNLKKNIFFYLIVAYGAFSIPFYFISYDSSGFVNAFFFPVMNLEFLRLNIIAVYRRRRGAVTMLITSILFAIAIAGYIWFAFRQDHSASALFQGICFILPGLGISIFYAGEFARTAVAERQRATEVENLSQEMIEKEREKQLILGLQNEILEKQVKERTAELEKSLQELKEAEEQLIQREKMASLGELTAGIAHEIQNPLNFVNNFSDLNIELIDELKQELEKGNLQDTAGITTDIRSNNEKINFHGKRADAIVKAMLQHSRISSGQKDPTDINALCDEYLRLSYHGLRARDKSFQARFETDFDEYAGMVPVVAQDIGRVILNLLNNAFYAVSARAREVTGGEYQPTVRIATRKYEDKIEIRVSDNGPGIPEGIKAKIFHPFFTTKPAGQGTGLGLSLSYDIIKAHGGTIKAESPDEGGTLFVIMLPL